MDHDLHTQEAIISVLGSRWLATRLRTLHRGEDLRDFSDIVIVVMDSFCFRCFFWVQRIRSRHRDQVLFCEMEGFTFT